MKKILMLVLGALVGTAVALNNAAGKSTMRRGVVTGFMPYAVDSSQTITINIWDGKNLINHRRSFAVSTHDGYFKFVFPLQSISSVTFSIDDVDVMGDPAIGVTGTIILLEPGDSLNLFIPKPDSRIPDIIFSGTGSIKQELLNDINTRLAELFHDPRWNDVDHRSIEESFELWSTTRKMLERSLENISDKISDDAIETLRVRLLGTVNYTVIQLLMMQDWTKSDRSWYDSYACVFPVSDLVSDFYMWEFPLQDRALLPYLVENHINYDPAMKNDPDRMYTQLDGYYHDHPLRSKILAAYLIFQARYKGVSSALEEKIERFYSDFPSEDIYRNQVEVVVIEMTQRLERTADAFNFELQDTAGNRVTMENFRGKVVLLDFMFTGCGGCAALTVHMEKFEQQFKNNDVAFVSVSIDRTLEAFKKGIGKFCSSSAYPLFTGGLGSEHPIVHYYGIVAYPTLVLINKQGKIIDGRAPSPGTPTGWDILSKLLQDEL